MNYSPESLKKKSEKPIGGQIFTGREKRRKGDNNRRAYNLNTSLGGGFGVPADRGLKKRKVNWLKKGEMKFQLKGRGRQASAEPRIFARNGGGVRRNLMVGGRGGQAFCLIGGKSENRDRLQGKTRNGLCGENGWSKGRRLFRDSEKTMWQLITVTRGNEAGER